MDINDMKTEVEILTEARKLYNSRSTDERTKHRVTYYHAQITTIDQLLYKLEIGYKKQRAELNGWRKNILRTIEKELQEIKEQD